MGRLLSEVEAEEIINTMCEERSLMPVAIKVIHDEYRTYCIQTKKRKFLWWKWQSKKIRKKSWLVGDTLINLIKQTETWMEGFDDRVDNEAQQVETLRQRHATRLLNKTMEK